MFEFYMVLAILCMLKLYDMKFKHFLFIAAVLIATPVVLNIFEKNHEEPIEYAEVGEITPADTMNLYVTGRYRISEAGKEFIKKHEALRLKRYKNPGERHFTIGYGHLMQFGETYSTISETKAEQLFNNDIRKVEASINRLLEELDENARFTQGFIDGLGSLIFNCGESGVRNTKFFESLKDCKWENYAFNYEDYNEAIEKVKTTKVIFKGHEQRRIGEYEMMVID